MQLNAKFGALSDWRLNAPAAIFIVCGPCVDTGEVLKWKVIVALLLDSTKLLAGIAFTLGVVAVFWEHAPVAALAILMACYAAGAALLYAKLVRLQRTCELFASTLDQLRKDRECLANNLR